MMGDLAVMEAVVSMTMMATDSRRLLTPPRTAAAPTAAYVSRQGCMMEPSMLRAPMDMREDLGWEVQAWNTEGIKKSREHTLIES